MQIIVEEKMPAAKFTPDVRVFQTTRCNEFPQEHHTGENARKGRTKASPHCHPSAWEGNQFLLLWDAEVYETLLRRITKVLSTGAHEQDLI